MEDFEEKEMMRFSWSGFFAVTGVSCFIFNLFLKFVEDENFPWLLIAGAVSLVISFCCFITRKQQLEKKKLRRRSPLFNEE